MVDRRWFIRAAASWAAAWASAAAAQEADPPSRRQPAHEGVRTWYVWEDQPREGRWSFQAEPAVWFASPGGRLTMPGSPPGSERTRLVDLNLDNPRPSPVLELNGWQGDLSLHLNAAHYRTRREAVAGHEGTVGPISFSEGESVSTKFDYTSFDARVGHRIAEFGMGETERGNEAVLLGIDAVGGMRMYNFGISFEREDERTSTSKTFLEPQVGVKVEAEFFEEFTLDASTMLGFSHAIGDQDVFSWNVWVGLQYRPTPNAGIQIGYRLQAFDLSRGSGEDRFAYRGAVAGLYAGVVLRF